MTAAAQNTRKIVPCPKCGWHLQVPSASYRIDSKGNRVPINPIGAWCRNGGCDYGAISLDHPNIPHPSLAARSATKNKTLDFKHYVLALAPMIPEVEIDPDRCGGRPVFTNSRLPLETIVSILRFGDTDRDILHNYPRLTPFLLTIVRTAIAAIPPPEIS